MTRHRKYKIDSVTGMRYEKGSLMDVMGKIEKPKIPYLSYSQYNGRKRRSSYDREPKINFNDIPHWAQALIGFLILGVFAWIFVINPFVEWVKQNIITISIIFVIIVTLLITGFVLYWKHKKKKKAEKEIFEEEQKAKGLLKFVDRFDNERWGKPDEVEKWNEEDEGAREKEKLINNVVSEIENFKPIRTYHNEFPYQIDLTRHLKTKFPDADIEQQKGSSRPDIVVGDVAIEVKGPTKTGDLVGISDKCMRYYQHFGELVIVLFETNVYEPRYEEWKKGMKNTFPNVRIIRK